MWRTLGHKNQKLFLENTLKNKVFSHAYLFSGPESIGKKTLAIEYANKILGVEDTSKINPDLIVLDQDKLKIEDFRNLMNDLSLKPYQYKHKVAIIDNFELVNDESANSILKTLEEPNPSTIIILIVRNKKAVLPTILSRTQVIHFNRFDLSKYSKLNLGKHVNLFDGKIGKAIRFNENEEYKKEFLQQEKEFSALKKNSIAEKIAAIKNFAELESEELRNLFHSWLDIEHYEVVSKNPENYKNMSLISEAILGIRQNLNKKLILQKLFLNLT